MTDTLSPERVAEIRALAAKATPGPWEVEDEQNDGNFGGGPDCNSGYKSYAVVAGNKTVVDTLNSDLAEIEEDGDCEDGSWRYSRWDEVGCRNAAYIAALDPQTVLALLASHEALRAEVGEAKADLAVLHADLSGEQAENRALRAEVERLKQNSRESDLARLARPPAPDGNGTTVGTQSVARLIQRINEYACFDENLRQLMREVASELTTARDAAAREMREACAKWVQDSDATLFMGRDVADGAKYREWLAKELDALPLPSETKETV